jgi:diguanylate cyclase (GGDEF)-like protein/PAS domain S-box-containing protein
MGTTTTGRQEQIDCEPNVIKEILEDAAERIQRRTPFQRVLATVYRVALLPGSAEPESAILEYACRGLNERQERELLDFLARAERISGERYRDSHRISDSYFFPQGRGLPATGIEIASTRRFLGIGTWQADDALLIPFWRKGRIAGQVSVDDPRDGARPRSETLQLLEELTSVAALALEDACELARLSTRHRLFHMLTESGMLGTLVILGDHIVYANEQALATTGYRLDEIESLSPWWQILHADDRPFAWETDTEREFVSRMIRVVRRDGRIIWLSACTHDVEFEGASAVAMQFFDITDQIRTEEQLKEKALRDALTGFRNRSYFDDAIQTEIKRSTRYRRPFTLVMADLAGFKRVNDTLGHQEGDRVLTGVAEVIRSQLRESDWAVRYGGDEFLLTLPETGPDIETLLKRLERAVDSWCRENVVDVPVGIDFGWATWRPDDPQPIASVVREADDRLYEAKRSRTTARGV